MTDRRHVDCTLGRRVRTIVVLACAIAAPAQAQITNKFCTTIIDSVPFVISSPGNYCLTRDLGFAGQTGPAIDIQASGVNLDLDGRVLSGTDSPSTIGIRTNRRVRVAVRNGYLTGFGTAIQMGDGTAASARVIYSQIVENLHIDRVDSRGIHVSAGGSIVRNNVISNVNPSSTGLAYGILVEGFDSRIIDNDVTRVIARGSGPLSAFGILISPDGGGSLVVENRVANTRNGVVESQASTVVCRDNLTSEVSNIRVSCGIDAGGNR